MSTAQPERIAEIVRYFLRLGLLGFGGPVALVGQMERELVVGRGWLSKEQIRGTIAICNHSPDCSRSRSGSTLRTYAGGFWGEPGRADGHSSCRTS